MASLTSLGAGWITKRFSSCFRLAGSLLSVPLRVGEGGLVDSSRGIAGGSRLDARALTRESDGGQGKAWPWRADQAYWAGRCQGFTVEDADGHHLGVVEHVVYVTRVDRPDLLAIGTKHWRHRTRAVPIGGIVEMRPSDRLLVVAMEGARSAGRAGAARALRRLAHALPLRERRAT